MQSRTALSIAAMTVATGVLVTAQTSAPPPQTPPQLGPIEFIDPEFPVLGALDLFSYDQPFLDLHGLGDFDAAKEVLDPLALNGFLGRLRTGAGGTVDGLGLIQIALYCSAPPANEHLAASEVRGVSLVRQFGAKREFHTYYAFDAAIDAYVEDASLAVWMNGPMTVSALHLLHFSSMPSSGALYTGNSALVMVDAPSFPGAVDSWSSGDVDSELLATVILDADYGVGLPLLGSASQVVYDATAGGGIGPVLVEDDPGLLSCDANPFCSEEEKTRACIWDWSEWDNICEDEKPVCSTEYIATEQAGTPLGLCWDFRDDFLAGSAKGQQYTSWYYAWCALAPMTLGDVPTYWSLLQTVTPAMQTLLDPSSDAVVITPAMGTAVLDRIAVLRTQTTNTTLLAMYDVVEADVMLYTGLTRSEFVELFEQ